MTLRVSENMPLSGLEGGVPKNPLRRTFTPGGSGLGQPGREFWIVDEEDTNPSESSALIRSQCPPFMLAPGFKMIPIGAGPGQYSTPVFEPTENIPKRPGFLSFTSEEIAMERKYLDYWTKQQIMDSYAEGDTVFGLGQLGAYWEVVAPAGGALATFRCRPFFVQGDLALKQVTGGVEILRQQGAAEFPEGTVRERTRALWTHRR